MKVIYNNIIPVKGFKAMNFCGIVFARKEYEPLDNITINHEAIHAQQMKELLYIPFYILYGLNWFVNIFSYSNSHSAYRNIIFEKEAYKNEKDLNYLKNRKRFAWVS